MSILGLHGWSSHSSSVDLGLPVPLDCWSCKRKGTVGLFLFYDWYSMAFVFGIVGRRQYALACTICGARREVPEHEVQGRQTLPARIPFYRRFGLILILGVPIVWFLLYALSEWIDVTR